MTSGITVTIDVVLLDSANPAYVVDVPEDYTGVGDVGDRFVYTDGHW